MKKQRLRLIACLAVLLLLTGCWDIKDLQTINYVTSIGLDYEDGQFIVYAQLLDFTSVAKLESGKVSEPPQQWVGKGTGATINLAMNNLYNTMQQKTLWSHVDSMVVSSSFLEHGLTEMADTLFRFREIRYTPWIYGTSDSIEQIFTTPGFFNLSKLITLLSEPMDNYEQKSYIAPMKYIRFISEAREPDKTILLPSIVVNRNQWKRNEQTERKLAIDGAFAIQNHTLKGWFDKESLTGLRWMESETTRTPLSIEKDGKTEAVITMGTPKIDIQVVEGTAEPQFSIRIRINGSVIEMFDSFTEKELIEKAQEQIETEIRSTYNKGLKTKTDLYSLGHVLYREQYPSWKSLHTGNRFWLQRDSLQSIDVKVFITNSGMLKLHPRKMPREMEGSG